MRRRPRTHVPTHLALAQPSPEPDGTPESPDDALDTVAAIIKALGRTCREEDAARTLDAWARHLLVLAPAPNGSAEARPTRDWRGARAYALGHIQRRSETTEQRLAGLRDVMWEMIESISRSVTAETEADDRVTDCMVRLRSALDAPTDELRRTAFGAIDELTSLLEERENRQQQLAGTLGGRIADLSVELAQARREAATDSLTGLANRAVFDRELERTTHLTTLTREPACLLMVDIDDFKAVNDAHGHPAGDALLKAVARAIVLTFPRKTDVVARYGGDEFAVILSNTTLDEAEALAERLLTNLRGLTVGEVNGDEITVTASVGVAELQPRLPVSTVMSRADEALYGAKHAGRDRVSAWRAA